MELIRDFMNKVEYKSPEQVDNFLAEEVGWGTGKIKGITWEMKMDATQEYIENLSKPEVEDLYDKYI